MSSAPIVVQRPDKDEPNQSKPRRLAPKPLSKQPAIVPSPVQRTAHISKRQPLKLSSGCGVCGRVGCQLRSHKAFISAHSRSNSTSSSSDEPKRKDAVYTKSYAYFYAQQYIDADLAAGKVDPFYDLPIREQSPELHKLFFDYFVQLKSAFRFPLPAGMPGDLIGGPLLVPAMNDEAVCLSVLATAASWPTVRAGLPFSVQALTLHTQAISNLRSRLYPDPAKITDGTLLAAILIWAMELLQSSLVSISAHAKSVHSLVNLRGGLWALAHAPSMLQLIIWLDALSGQILEEEMRFNAVHEPTAMGIDLPKHKYGDLIEKSKSSRHSPTDGQLGDRPPPSALTKAQTTHFTADLIDPDLIKIFLDMCRATELLEEALAHGINFQKFQYAMMLVNYIIAQLAVIHARYKSSKSWDRCLCITLNIYYLLTFHPGQDMRPFPLRLCARLRPAIEEAKSSNKPLSTEMLIWMAFVPATVPHRFEEREYFMDVLSRAISNKFGSTDWPHGWDTEICQVLNGVVWSDTRHASAFGNVCRELRQRTVPSDFNN